MAAGGFKDAAVWIRVSFITMSTGFLLDLFAFAINMGDYDMTTIALLVTGFLCFLIAFILSMIVTFIEESRLNNLLKICLIVFALAAGVLTLAGIGTWGVRNGGNVNTYATLVGVCGSTLAILTAVFVFLDLCKCKPCAKK